MLSTIKATKDNRISPDYNLGIHFYRVDKKHDGSMRMGFELLA